MKKTHILILIITSIGISFFTLFIGRYKINFFDILMEFPNIFQSKSNDLKIIFLLRLPRILIAFSTGAILATSGLVYQSLFRNPLVSPDILGISSGASLGAALAILFSFSHPVIIQLFAFILAIIAVFVAFQLAVISRGHNVMMLVMAGIVVSSFCGAVLSFLKYIADPYNQLPAIIFWMMGGLYKVSWDDVLWTVPLVTVSLLLMFFLRRTLNVISLGDEEAISLGINVKKMRAILIVLSTLGVGATISITGVIAWVGLVIPHISRIIFGVNHSISLPCSIFLGGTFLVIIDTIARSISSQEIPLGVLTALIGAPFFAYLLLFKQNKGWGKC